MIGWILGNLKLAGLAVGGVLLAIAVAFIRKSGADAEKLKQAKADIKASSEIAKQRAKARGASDDQLDKEIDRWTRK